MAVSIHTLLIRIDTDDGLDQLAALQKTIEDDARLLILAFSSAQPDQLVNLMPWVEALWPMATVAGAYGPQIIHQGEISENTLLLQFMTFERTELRLNYL
ncbi:MAG: hypothetical protein WD668_12015, partial [Saccharospirillum sp.]